MALDHRPQDDDVYRMTLAAVAELIPAVGTEGFMARLLDAVGVVADHDMRMIAHYSSLSPPRCLLQSGYGGDVMDLWESGYFAFDPLYALCRQGNLPPVAVFSEVEINQLNISRGWRRYLNRVRIADEMALVLPGLGLGRIAVVLDRADCNFGPAEVAIAKAAQPAFASVFRSHLERTLTHFAGDGGSDGADRAIMVHDRNGRHVFSTPAWEAAADAAGVKAALARHARHSPFLDDLGGGWSLHGEHLRDDADMAPGGWLFVLEQHVPGPSPRGFDEAVEAFAQPGLTGRERQIVEMILAGYATIDIARDLDIGVGTVKNHRKRLYGKLGISSERELFSLFINHVLSDSGS